MADLNYCHKNEKNKHLHENLKERETIQKESRKYPRCPKIR